MFSKTVRLNFLARPNFAAPRHQLIAARPIHQSTRQLARKDAQDKDSLKPEGNEYSKSGSDAESAQVEETAFSPEGTRPEEQHESAGEESQSGVSLHFKAKGYDLHITERFQ